MVKAKHCNCRVSLFEQAFVSVHALPINVSQKREHVNKTKAFFFSLPSPCLGLYPVPATSSEYCHSFHLHSPGLAAVFVATATSRQDIQNCGYSLPNNLIDLLMSVLSTVLSYFQSTIQYNMVLSLYHIFMILY